MVGWPPWSADPPDRNAACRYVPDVPQRDIPPFEVLDEAQHFLDPIETQTLIDRIGRQLCEGVIGASALRPWRGTVWPRGYPGSVALCDEPG